MTRLRLADGFDLPLEAVTETFAILAKRGSGKTSTAVVLAEEMIGAGQQVLVIDPTGVWWGLRAGRGGGQSGGLPVVIVGGDHADLPLTEADGAALAKLLVVEQVSAVLDLSQLSKSATRRVMADFLETLYRVNRDPLHLIVDEADLLAPQRLPKDMLRLLGAMDDVVRRGRAHGLGVTLITQRPAVLNKDVLGQAEVLIALRMTSPRDVAAIDEWIRLHADTDQATELRRSLPSLPVGTAWIWSPGWLERLDRVTIRPRDTFDSSATPRPGTIVRRPRLATVDVARLRDQMAAGPGPAPVAGRGSAVAAEARIRELEATIRDLLSRPAPVEVREVPVLDAAARAQIDGFGERIDDLTAALHQLRTILTTVLETTASSSTAPVLAPQSTSRGSDQAPREAANHVLAIEVGPSTGPKAAANGTPLRAGARRMLEAMVSHHPARLTRAQLATLARMKPTSGTFSTYLSNLRQAGYLDERDGYLQLTAEGRTALGAGSPSAPLTAAQVRDQWRQAMRAGARRMLDLLIDAHPAAIPRVDLARAAGLEPTSGTFSTYLSNLRRNGLVHETAQGLTAASILFQDPATPA